MKMNIEIDCSPEEARALLGLPDVTKANEAYVEKVTNLMNGAGGIDQLQELGNCAYGANGAAIIPATH